MTDRNNAMCSAATPAANMSSAALFALFGKKPVLATENETTYDSLREAIVAEVQPRDVFEHYHAKRYLDLSWEAMRYQRCATAIIEMTCKSAIEALVHEFAEDGLKGYTPEQLVEGWFRDLEIRDLLIETLRPYGLDEDSVVAQSMAMRSGELARISEMRTRAEVQAAAHMREIERHRERCNEAKLIDILEKSDADRLSAA